MTRVGEKSLKMTHHCESPEYYYDDSWPAENAFKWPDWLGSGKSSVGAGGKIRVEKLQSGTGLMRLSKRVLLTTIQGTVGLIKVSFF